MGDKETKATKEYQETFDKSNEWLLEHAPDFVKDNIDELVSYIEYLQNTIEEKDDLLVRYEAVVVKATAVMEEEREHDEKINRIEVIGGDREFVKYLEDNEKCRLTYQDEGRTLKIFVKEEEETT